MDQEKLGVILLDRHWFSLIKRGKPYCIYVREKGSRYQGGR